MIKSNEARELARAKKEQEEKAIEEQVTNFCDIEASRAISNAAKSGYNCAVIQCPKDLCGRVIHKLRVEGDFAVTDNLDGTLSICW